MNLFRCGILGVWLFAVGAAISAQADFETEIRPLLEQHCLSCHNPDRLRGDLDLDRFKSQALAADSIAVWQRAGKRIEAREMPPRRGPQPTEEEREKLLTWIRDLRENEEDCNRIASEETVNWYPGYVMSRRLNRAEYENTLRDLFGIEIPVADLFPADGAGGEGFDNNGNALFLSAIQIEKYLQAADLAVETVFPRDRQGPAASLGQFLRRTVTFQWLPSEDRKALASARRQLVTARPGLRGDARAAARTVLEDFTERAWRRPPEDAELEGLLGMFERGQARGDGYIASLKLAFKGALVSPHFLFLAEPEPPTPGEYALGDFQLASRLSYFLWASMPDAELFRLARAGKLQDTEILREQVQRMLNDPKAAGLGRQFATQWLGITQLGETTRPDAERFPEFDGALALAMREEVIYFFNHLIAEDRSLLELIQADYTFANERLAALYGVEGITGPRLQRVQLADNRRGGVLGMAAVLTTTSHPLRTSPVLRGKWVLEQLLGDRVPPPPPDAGTLPEDDAHPEGLSLREQLEAHRKNPDCASCHARMDPIGFGLENFDPIGRWREAQAGQPLDTTGTLPSGESFDGPVELKALILERKAEFTKNLSRKMLGYALGRSLTRLDNCVIDDAMFALQENDYRPSALITQIVLSHPFRHRYSGSRSVPASEATDEAL